MGIGLCCVRYDILFATHIVPLSAPRVSKSQEANCLTWNSRPSFSFRVASAVRM